jgi:hypothetical protein
MRNFGIAVLILVLTFQARAAETLSAFTGISPYSALDITTNFNANIASSTYNWNKNNSRDQLLVLKVRSLYGGLRHTTATTSKINYTWTYTGTGALAGVTMSTADQNIMSRTITAGTAQGTSGAVNNTMAYTGVAANLLYQGTYTDTVTLTYTVTPTGQATTTLPSLTLVITATAIGATLAFSITPLAIASNLPLAANQTDLAVGTAFETSNSATGYLVQVRSANGGFLKHSAAGASPPATEKIDYTSKYAGTSMTLTPAATDWTIKTVPAGIYNSSSNGITLSYTAPGAGGVISGNYSDTLTFTIQAQ